MKKLIAIIMFVIPAIAGFAVELKHENIEITDSTISLSKSWDGVMRWVVANEDKYGMRIAYENPSTGSLIIKGEFKDTSNHLQSVQNDLIKPIASFTIEVKCYDGKVLAEMTEANYEYKVGYGSIYSLSGFQLKWCKQEMEEIENIMRYKGDKVNCYDTYFEETAKEYSDKKEEAKAIEEDEALPKKERKKAKKYLEQNRWRDSPYKYVYWMPSFTSYELFRGEKGLVKYITQ